MEDSTNKSQNLNSIFTINVPDLLKEFNISLTISVYQCCNPIHLNKVLSA